MVPVPAGGPGGLSGGGDPPCSGDPHTQPQLQGTVTSPVPLDPAALPQSVASERRGLARAPAKPLSQETGRPGRLGLSQDRRSGLPTHSTRGRHTEGRYMELPAAEASPLPHPRQLQGPPKPATRPLPRQAYSSPLLPALVRLGPGPPSGGKMSITFLVFAERSFQMRGGGGGWSPNPGWST